VCVCERERERKREREKERMILWERNRREEREGILNNNLLMSRELEQDLAKLEQEMCKQSE
jgi:hypothetical protein